jgi:hypothetical protein
VQQWDGAHVDAHDECMGMMHVHDDCAYDEYAYTHMVSLS